MFDTLLSSTTGTTVSFMYVILGMLSALATGGIISLTYMKTHPNGKYSQNFALTMILLPAVISIIIMLIGSDIAKAFSLAGAFSIIRFRSAPGEPKDITYVLFAMAAGLASGVGVFSYAVMVTLILCLVMFLLSKTRFGQHQGTTKELQIMVPEDLAYEEAFEEVLNDYTIQHDIKRIKTAAMGSLYQITYEVVLKEKVSTKAFIDELRCRNGNLNISLNLVELQQVS